MDGQAVYVGIPLYTKIRSVSPVSRPFLHSLRLGSEQEYAGMHKIRASLTSMIQAPPRCVRRARCFRNVKMKEPAPPLQAVPLEVRKGRYLANSITRWNTSTEGFLVGGSLRVSQRSGIWAGPCRLIADSVKPPFTEQPSRFQAVKGVFIEMCFSLRSDVLGVIVICT